MLCVDWTMIVSFSLRATLGGEYDLPDTAPVSAPPAGASCIEKHGDASIIKDSALAAMKVMGLCIVTSSLKLTGFSAETLPWAPSCFPGQCETINQAHYNECKVNDLKYHISLQ